MKVWEVIVFTLQSPMPQNHAGIIGPQRHRDKYCFGSFTLVIDAYSVKMANEN